jgi:PERQ amino acid-rich with GYF domain-containing protein
VDEFITMLLDFPIDPDASTIEIISEFVYSNSSTLDGRRFASEFVAKRKADATSRKVPAGKPISIAEGNVEHFV